MTAAGVTVIVPVRDGAAVLDACLTALADQEYPRHAVEVLVVDNGSLDGSAAIAARHGVRCLDGRAVATSYAARNIGVRAAAHSFLAFTDADCIASPGWLRAAMAAFRDAAVGCVCGPIACAAPETWVQRYQERRGLLSHDETLHHRYRPYAQTANAVYRRAVFDAIGLFEERWPSGGDADLGWRMLAHGAYTLRFEPGAVVSHRHRPTVGALLRQRLRHGQGNALLAEKYGALANGAEAHSRRPPFWQRDHRRGLWRRDAVLELLSVAAFHLGRLAPR